MKQFILIEGIFSNDEAKQIADNLFQSKLQFHEHKNFSSIERFGKNDQTAITRIPELKKSIQEINLLFENAKKENKIVQLSSVIKVTLIDK